MDSEDDLGAGVEGAAMTFFAGLLLPFLFNSFTQQQDFVVSIIVFAAFASCVMYGELYLSLTSGVSFGFGMLLTSFAAQNLWLIGLAVSSSAINLSIHASGHQMAGSEWRDDSVFSPERPLVLPWDD